MRGMGDLRHLWTDAYLAALAEHGLVGRAAKDAGVDRSQVWRRRQDDPEFDAAVKDAIEHAADKLETEARRRAIDGTEEPVYQGGVLVGTKRVFSDSLLALLLKGRRKGVFAERTELTGAGGGPVGVADETQRAARAAALLAAAKARREAAGLPPDPVEDDEIA